MQRSIIESSKHLHAFIGRINLRARSFVWLYARKIVARHPRTIDAEGKLNHDDDFHVHLTINGQDQFSHLLKALRKKEF